MAYSWEDLAALALGRQFPEVAGRDVEAVVEAGQRVGPVQAQTARSPYVGLAARLPGVAKATIDAAYEASAFVRGSTLRGTVHACVAADHPLLDAVTRLGNRPLWARTLRLVETSLEEVWEGIEAYAAPGWRTVAELVDHLAAWLAAHDPAAQPALTNAAGRFFALGHGGLVRRPLSGGWEGQGAPGYRTASVLLGDAGERSRLAADPAAVLDAAVRRHLSAHGPASRQDIAWWSGVGLRPVDAALARLAGELTATPGPDGRLYHDVAESPAPARTLTGVRLLPEFDALLCGYDPPARTRFIDPATTQCSGPRRTGSSRRRCWWTGGSPGTGG